MAKKLVKTVKKSSTPYIDPQQRDIMRNAEMAKKTAKFVDKTMSTHSSMLDKVNAYNAKKKTKSK